MAQSPRLMKGGQESYAFDGVFTVTAIIAPRPAV
jgi:hypothetical protein